MKFNGPQSTRKTHSGVCAAGTRSPGLHWSDRAE